jgi:RHS repeat-associated protein
MFTGDTQDIVSGLMDTPNREYSNAGQGRWISPDPAGASWNAYAYATNPNSLVDTTGLDVDPPLGGFHSCPGGFSTQNGCAFDTAQGDDPDCSGCSTGYVSTSAFIGAQIIDGQISGGQMIYASVIGTDGTVYLDTFSGVWRGSSNGALGVPDDGGWHFTPDPAANLVGGTFNAPGAALNAAVCSGSTACTVGLGLGLIIIGEGLGAVGDYEILDASTIRFSQNSVNDVAPIVQSMSENGWVGDPIVVVRMADGGLTTVDNTRLLAASLTNTPVQATVVDGSAAIDASQAIRFVGQDGSLPSTWGEAVANRIANQTGGFGNVYPNGSPFTGVPQ